MLLQKKTNLQCTSHTLFETKKAKINALFLTKTIQNHTLWGSQYEKVPLPPRRKSTVISVRCVQRKDTYLSCLRESSLDLRQLIKFHLVSVRLMVDPWLEFKELKRVALVKCIEREPRSTSLWRKTTNEQLASTFLVLKYLWKYHSV